MADSTIFIGEINSRPSYMSFQRLPFHREPSFPQTWKVKRRDKIQLIFDSNAKHLICHQVSYLGGTLDVALKCVHLYLKQNLQIPCVWPSIKFSTTTTLNNRSIAFNLYREKVSWCPFSATHSFSQSSWPVLGEENLPTPLHMKQWGGKEVDPSFRH